VIGPDPFFEPGLAAYLNYCVGFCLRYFAVLGGIYWFFHLGFRRSWLPYRIQASAPSRGEVAHEIRWSMYSMLTTGVTTMLLYGLIRNGDTSLYLSVEDRGWPYLLLSIALGIAGYDAWIYWQHRLMHTSWCFRHIHSVHHAVTNPTPFAAFCRHPIEALTEHAYFFLLLVLVPVHPLAMLAIVGFFFVYGIVGHLGFEFCPQGFTRHPLFQWINTSTHHNMHHTREACHFGNWFNHWDRMMGTIHPECHETFGAVTTRRAAMRRPPLEAAAPAPMRRAPAEPPGEAQEAGAVCAPAGAAHEARVQRPVGSLGSQPSPRGTAARA